ncbi:MAG TPA: glycoside hydrolase family 3 N-terminal domain-containing protein [Ktedonobacteraceae bacterium]|nr:glycoside hydrolase family 3 N-terminal domain-containing protein [Ktedonobacteraceae bacterium]
MKTQKTNFPARRGTVMALLTCFLVILSGCSFGLGSSHTYLAPSSSTTPTVSYPVNVPPQPTEAPLTDDQLAAQIVSHMTLDQKLGQMVISEFYGSTFDASSNALAQMIQNYGISGVLIENKNGNAQTQTQLVTLIQAMQKAAHIPLLVTTDFEGGLVNELRLIVGERPSEQQIGATNDPQQAYNAGRAAATTLTSLGLNVNFMPIVDVLTNPNNPGLPQRTFGSDPTLVTNMGRAYLKGLTDGGVVGCLKHFPGLGSATVDPHFSLPTMNRSLATLNAVDFVPYRTMINEGIVPMVMVTHILNPQLDPKLPTSLSPNVVTGILRNQLNFKGVIISDTLWMGGISNNYSLPQAAVLAIKAGEDLILGPRGLSDTVNMLAGMKQAVTSGQIQQSTIDASAQRIIAMKLHYKIISHTLALQLAQPSQSNVSGTTVAKASIAIGKSKVVAVVGVGDVRRF